MQIVDSCSHCGKIRFYFLSNDELLEILSKTKEPERIQPHLSKCFDGIDNLVFDEKQEIHAMVSVEKEVVGFNNNIIPAKSKVCNNFSRTSPNENLNISKLILLSNQRVWWSCGWQK